VPSDKGRIFGGFGGIVWEFGGKLYLALFGWCAEKRRIIK